MLRWLVRRADEREDKGTTHSARHALPPTPDFVVRQLGLRPAVAPSPSKVSLAYVIRAEVRVFSLLRLSSRSFAFHFRLHDIVITPFASNALSSFACIASRATNRGCWYHLRHQPHCRHDHLFYIPTNTPDKPITHDEAQGASHA